MPPYFSSNDKTLLEALEYSSLLKPNYELIKSCLTWADEVPEKISSDGYSLIGDLWVARFFIYHLGKPEKDWWALDPEYFKNVWESIIESGLKWPGFRPERLYLNKEDKDYLERELEAAMCEEF